MAIFLDVHGPFDIIVSPDSTDSGLLLTLCEADSIDLLLSPCRIFVHICSERGFHVAFINGIFFVHYSPSAPLFVPATHAAHRWFVLCEVITWFCCARLLLRWRLVRVAIVIVNLCWLCSLVILVVFRLEVNLTHLYLSSFSQVVCQLSGGSILLASQSRPSLRAQYRPEILFVVVKDLLVDRWLTQSGRRLWSSQSVWQLLLVLMNVVEHCIVHIVRGSLGLLEVPGCLWGTHGLGVGTVGRCGEVSLVDRWNRTVGCWNT